ncbi:hypothetical protein ACLB2K_001194 [Fragaria x ananassa]
MVRSLLSATFSSRPSFAVKPPETATVVPKASPSSLLHCWIGGASSGAAVRDKSSSKTPPVRIRCRSNFSFLRSPFDGQGSSSAYVVADFDGQRKRTVTKYKDLNPVWNEPLEFVVSDPDNMDYEELEIEVLNDKRYGNSGTARKNHFLGRVKLYGTQFSKRGDEGLVEAEEQPEISEAYAVSAVPFFVFAKSVLVCCPDEIVLMFQSWVLLGFRRLGTVELPYDLTDSVAIQEWSSLVHCNYPMDWDFARIREGNRMGQITSLKHCPYITSLGSVFRGIFDGDVAAVKQMTGNVSKEINLLNKINHSNLIRLSGVCFNDGHWYLIYEYAANGPLSDWIYFEENDGKLLSWTQRVQIMLDVASGLDYLHSFTTPPHVHKDIKSSNILLDSDFRAKIADFGLARSADAQDGHFSLTNHIVGTIGYMAPEYLENGLISTKLDVYAFGALMLELLTGKEVTVLYEQHMHLSDTLYSLLNNEDGGQSLRQFMDPALQENYPQELAIFVIRLIDSCLKKNPGSRPIMNEMVQFLSRTMSNSLTWELSSNNSGYQGSVGVLDGTETG